MAKKKGETQKIEPGWLNKKNMAKSLGISVQAFGNWGVEPITKIGNQTFYTVSDVLKNRTSKSNDKEATNSNLPEGFERSWVDFAQYRKTSADADIREAEAAVIKRTHGHVDLLVWALSKTSEITATNLEAIPGEVRRMLPTLTAQEIKTIDEIIAKRSNHIATLELPWEELEGVN